MRYRRAKITGGSFFFTLITHDRRKILTIPENILLLKECFRAVMTGHPFTIDAIVILPEHLHCIWTLPIDDNDYPMRWRLIKSAFSRQCGVECRGVPSASREAKREQAVWQRRYWEHQIKDEEDLINHFDYIHFNPVKHGHVKAPRDWVHSSFHRYVREGKYPVNWGCDTDIRFNADVGAE